MRLVIVVHSFTGNNRLLAREIAARTGAEVVEVETVGRRRAWSILLDLVLKRRPRVRPLAVDPAGFDRVLVIAPLWDRHVAFPMASALAALSGRMPGYDFVTLCGYAREGQAETVRRELTELAGRAPDRIDELHVGDLVPEAERRNVRKVSGRRVSRADLGAFAPRIAEIAARYGARGPAEAG